MNKKRGMSPVVATVLLIAIVIVIGLIVFLWFKGITDEAITKFDGTNVKLVCEQVSFSAEYSNGNIGISNDGNVPIFKMKAKIIGAGSYETVVVGEGDSNWQSTGLNQGDAYEGSLELNGATKILLIPVLIGQTESEGKKLYTCDEMYGKEIVVS
ncbi:hypothetical protein GW931_03685 [archaeon]|nr:hypothetical protein [archaeon]PJC45675.1 MAG: hypothetical protein CO037_00315 [Candidatus Pacearchaeota archaeon CG_4_9_14_0_2_um_filter_30_8]